MTRTAFLAALEQLLAPLPEAERKDALSYYEDYLDAAGPEKEAQAIAELGTPEEVARKILEEQAPADSSAAPASPARKPRSTLAHGAGRRAGSAGAGLHFSVPVFQGCPGAAGGIHFSCLGTSCFLCGNSCRECLHAAHSSRFYFRRLDFLPLC